jgi:hypothetical protein
VVLLLLLSESKARERETHSVALLFYSGVCIIPIQRSHTEINFIVGAGCGVLTNLKNK